MDKYNEITKCFEGVKTKDAAFSTADVDHTADYLWAWVEGRDIPDTINRNVTNSIAVEYRAGKITEEEAYKKIEAMALKELDNFYSQLRKSVERRLKAGYSANAKRIKELNG